MSLMRTVAVSRSSVPSRPISSASATWVFSIFRTSWSWRRALCARRPLCAPRCATSSARSSSTSSRTRPSSRWSCSPRCSATTPLLRWATRIRRFTGGGGPRPRPWRRSSSASRRGSPRRTRPSHCPPRGATTCRSWTRRIAWPRRCGRWLPISRVRTRSRRSRLFWCLVRARGRAGSRSPIRRPTTRPWRRWSTSCSGCARSRSRAASGARSQS